VRRQDDERGAIVTGAASGIGRAVAGRPERDGFGVLAVDVELNEHGPGQAFTADLLTRAGNRATVDAAIEQSGRLDLIVANAGFQHVAPVEEFPEERWEALVSLLLASPFLLAKYSWPHLRASRSGRVVVMASVHGQVASPFKAGYVSAKHGVLGLVKVLRLEGAEHGIAAIAVCPAFGWWRTRSLLKRRPTASRKTGCWRTSSWQPMPSNA
jgi:3-hydroxybutyrate dehydrogenase